MPLDLAVLTQTQQDGTTPPVTYASRTLQHHERNDGVTELEALGVVWAYITSDTISTCGVFTDHEALKTLLNTPHPTGKLAHWGLSLQELDLHTHYSPGAKNGNADALSRYPTETLDVESDDIAPQVAALQSEVASAKGGDLSLATRQDQDP
jgi:hypothetical protein